MPIDNQPAAILEAISAVLPSSRRYDQKLPLTVRPGPERTDIQRWHNEPVVKVLEQVLGHGNSERLTVGESTRTVWPEQGFLIGIERQGSIVVVDYDRKVTAKPYRETVWQDAKVGYPTLDQLLKITTAEAFIRGLMETVQEGRRRLLDKVSDLDKRNLALQHLLTHGPNSQFKAKAAG